MNNTEFKLIILNGFIYSILGYISLMNNMTILLWVSITIAFTCSILSIILEDSTKREKV